MITQIKKRIEIEMLTFDEKFVPWVRAHLIEPRPIKVVVNYEKGTRLRPFGW